MSKILQRLRVARLLPVIVCLGALLSGQHALAATTYSSGVTVKTADSAKGKVYVSTDKNKVPATAEYKDEMTADTDKSETQTHEYFARAISADPAYVFGYWEYNGSKVSTDANATFSFNGGKDGTDAKVTRTYTAYFIPKPAVTVTNPNPNVATVSISALENKVGDTVTLTATMKKVSAYNCRNLLYSFDGWEDQEGNILSRDLKYTFTITDPVDIKARIIYHGGLKLRGYYRVRNLFNRVLTLEGSFDWAPSASSSNFCPAELIRFSCPKDIDKWKGDFNGKVFGLTDDNPGVEVETMPSTVMFIAGDKMEGNNLVNASASAQGADTYGITGQYFSVEEMAEASFPGYHGFKIGGSYAIKRGTKTENGQEACPVLFGSYKANDPYSAMVLQPLDEEHMDMFWFGAAPAEEMAVDDGFLTTMYTAFPYQCHDGVKAYVVKETVTASGAKYAKLSEIETGTVPANTAVILKCPSLESKGNRLVPIDPQTTIEPVGDNLLKGALQLYTNKEGDGRISFNGNSMRVLSVNSAGVIGFYKLKKADDGTDLQLLPNRAYLDVSQQADKAPSYHVTFDDLSGVEDVSAEPGVSLDEDEKVIYDLYGRRVVNPAPGGIYIINGKKVRVP